MRPILIGLAGQKGAGKDTAAGGLPQAVKIAFAGPVKQMLAVGLGLTEAQLNGGEKSRPVAWLGDGTDITPRYLMQSLGTEWGRTLVDPDVWVKLAARKVDDELARGADGQQGRSVILVTDVRYESEANMIRARGGVIVHILRNRKPVRGIREKLLRLWDMLTDHSSEVRLPVHPADMIVLNVGTVEELQQQLRQVVEKLEKIL